MTDATLAFDQVRELAAEFSRIYTGWTWPEVLRALRAVLARDLADAVAPRVFELAPTEPRHPEAVLVEALSPWTLLPPDLPLILRPQEPRSSGTVPEGLPDLYDVTQLAHWLDFTVPELEWFADRGGWLRTSRPPLRHYRIWRRSKRDGFRVIEAPKPRMRETQRRLLRRLVEHVPAHPCARFRGRIVDHRFRVAALRSTRRTARRPPTLLRNHHHYPGAQGVP